MKTKTLLIVISSTALFFTSCEKDEMDKGGFGVGGGMENSLNSKKASIIIITEDDTVVSSTTIIGVISEV